MRVVLGLRPQRGLSGKTGGLGHSMISGIRDFETQRQRNRVPRVALRHSAVEHSGEMTLLRYCPPVHVIGHELGQ